MVWLGQSISSALRLAMSVCEPPRCHSIRYRVILETQAEHLLACLKAGTVSTNIHLRKLHNFCISMNWLQWPLIPKRLWPEVRFKDKRAITNEEHQLISPAQFL
jgi:hypothetical protein